MITRSLLITIIVLRFESEFVEFTLMLNVTLIEFYQARRAKIYKAKKAVWIVCAILLQVVLCIIDFPSTMLGYPLLAVLSSIAVPALMITLISDGKAILDSCQDYKGKLESEKQSVGKN